jgi:hypothetical protein
MSSLIPMLIVGSPVLLAVISMARVGYFRGLAILGGWFVILFSVGLINELPIPSRLIAGLATFALPLFVLWKDKALDGWSLSRRLRWFASAYWITIWYLLFDKTGLDLITWIVVWPVVLQLAWKGLDPQERDIRYLFSKILRRKISSKDKAIIKSLSANIKRRDES